MRVAVDIDDVTADIVLPLALYHNQVAHTNLSYEEYWTFDLSQVWKCSKDEMLQEVYDFYRSPLMDEIVPVAGAIDGLTTLTKIVDLAFVTSRPDFLQGKTEKWMQNYFPDVKIPIYFTNQFSLGKSAKQTKSDICTMVGASMMIEDAPVYAVDCAEKNIDVLLYDRPWNKDLPETEKITRVKTWEDIVEKINQEIKLNR